MPLFRDVAREVRASVEDPTYPLTSSVLMNLFGRGGRTDAGINVTPESAMGLSPVWRAVALISGLAASLPLHAYKRGSFDQLSASVLDDPHPELTPLEFWRLTYVHRLLWGNHYSQKVKNRAGLLTWLYPISPDRVRVGRVKPTTDNPSGKIFEVTGDDGVVQAMTTKEIFHLPGLGYDGVCGVSPIRAARQAIGFGLAAEAYGAKLFGSGTLLSGILQVEQRLKEGEAESLRNRWREKAAGIANAQDVGVLDAGAKFQPLTMPNDDAQFIESRRFTITDVARFFGVPPFLLLETEKSTSWGTGLEQQATGFVKFDLYPQWLAPTEQRITKELLPAKEHYARYTVDGLLRGDSAARAEFYTALSNVGAFSPNMILALEDKPPIDGGDQHFRPPGSVPLVEPVAEPVAEPEAEPVVSEEDGAAAKVRAIFEMVQKGYLGVQGNKLLTVEEGRELLNRAGAELASLSLPEEPEDPAPEPPLIPDAPAPANPDDEVPAP